MEIMNKKLTEVEIQVTKNHTGFLSLTTNQGGANKIIIMKYSFIAFGLTKILNSNNINN